ncbi:Crp/Fnr family transcriptional regulator [Litorilituus sediminis]|uniref:Crp/Fnr family transcriptional regulator n=1 Tax=Litorilituus sediminis TaxID=718192 RepID=UPI001FE64B25|nr:Crp/Fnr family transcriptional regulator [Litorilituus sediminis]
MPENNLPYHALGEICQHCQSLMLALLAENPQLKRRNYRRGDILLMQGNRQELGYYLEQGMLVSSRVNEEGRVRYKEFYFPTELSLLFAEWLRKTPSYYQISALADAQVVEVPLVLLDSLKWQTLRLRLLEQQLLFKEAKEAFLLLNTLEQRYQFLQQYKANWLEAVSNQDLANYLATTPQALSRLKTRIKQS